MPSSVVALRKATMLSLTVPGLSFIVYQADWPPLFVSSGPSVAPPGEVWMTLCPNQFRAALCGEFEGDVDKLIGPTLGRCDCEIQIDLVPSGSTTIDDAGVFAVEGGEGVGVFGFAAPADSSLFHPAHQPIEEVLPCGRTVALAPPDILEVDVDLGVGVAGWRHELRNREARRLANHTAFESLLALTVDDITRFAADER